MQASVSSFSSSPSRVPAASCRRLRGLARLAAMAAAAASFLAMQAAFAKDVTFVTDFGVNGRHAYFFVALDKGYYKEAGLNVTIVRSQGSADAVKQVAAGNAHIGIADAGAVVLARGNDNMPVKLVSIVYAKPPQAIYALESSGIRSPKDLEGRKVADTASSAMKVLFNAYAKAAKIDASKVTWQVADSASLPALLASRRADAIGQFIVGEPLLQKAVGGQKLVRLAYGDAGLDYYANGLIASESMIASDLDMIRKFAAATVRGMQESFRDPIAAGAIIHKYHRQVDPEVAAGEIRLVQTLAVTPGKPLGLIDPAGVQRTVDVMSGAYTMRRAVTAAEVFAPGFVAP